MFLCVIRKFQQITGTPTLMMKRIDEELLMSISWCYYMVSADNNSHPYVFRMENIQYRYLIQILIWKEN